MNDRATQELNGLRIIGVVAALTLSLAVLCWRMDVSTKLPHSHVIVSPQPKPIEVRMGFIPEVSLTELGALPTFVAKVVSKRVEISEGLLMPQSEGVVPSHVTFTNLIIALENQQGGALSVCERNPGSNALAFASQLQEGDRYEFPTILHKWQR